jgi:hypothetical protein
VTGRFDTLIYTDCRSGQGLQGTAGLQFQARSAGADGRAMSIVQRNLLYEPPPSWMRERRPVGEYPPSFAHVWDGLLATAAGVYLGRESVGGREGNQLTHSITTRDPAAYSLVRPAQLYGASFWTTKPALSTECPSLESGWRPGPFGAAEAQEFVRSQPQGAELLRTLLSELRRNVANRGRRVLFVAREPSAVLRWLTAATLLLPQREALRVGFKVFTLNPAYAPHHVLAVHPDWSATGVDLDHDQGYVVVDLVRHAWSRVEPSPRARLWTDLFLSEDPFDVIDAVEVAAASGLRSDAAVAVALAAILGRKPDRGGASDLVSWLRRGPPPLVRRYGPGIIDLFIDSGPEWPTEILLGLHEASRQADFPHRAAAVRLALIEAELQEAMSTCLVRPGSVSRLAPDSWGSSEQTSATLLLSDALHTATPAQFNAALRICGRFGIRPAIGELQPGLRRFILDWADHPERPYDPRSWPGHDEIDLLLREEIGSRLSGDPSGDEELGDRWWEILLREPMRIDTILDAVVVSAALRHLPPEQQQDLVVECLQEAADDANPIAAVATTSAVVWAFRSTTPTEARLLCRVLPTGTSLDPQIFAVLASRLTRGYVPSADDLIAGQTLLKHGLWTPSRQVTETIDGHLAMQQVIAQLQKEHPDIAALTLATLKVPLHVVQAKAGDLQDAMLGAPLAAATVRVLEKAPMMTGPLSKQLCREVAGNSRPSHIALAFVLVNVKVVSFAVAGQLSDRTRTDLERALRKWLARSSQKRFEEVTAQVGALGPLWSPYWQAIVKDGRRQGIRRLLSGRGR